MDEEILKDWLPSEFFNEFMDTKAAQLLNQTVIRDFGSWKVSHPFKHKYIHNWVILANGFAVGWNENPSVGWSFPVKKLNKKLLDFYSRFQSRDWQKEI